jgi:hypothetical protein
MKRLQRTQPRRNNNKQDAANRETNTILSRLLIAQTEAAGLTIPRVPDVPMVDFKRNKVHTFVRHTAPFTISVDPTTDTQFAYGFTLAGLPDSTDFTNLFDQYRIGTVRVNFTAADTFGVVSVPTLIYTAIDYDDNNVATVSALTEYDSFMQATLGFSFYRTLQPRPAVAMYSGAFTSFGSPSPLIWLDVASPSILYYGLKGIIPHITGITAAVAYVITFEVTVQCRQTR